MSKFKKIIVFSLLILTAFAALLSVTSCKKAKDESGIYIVSKETFESKIGLDESGNIAKAFSSKEISGHEVEYLQDGKEYFALVYIRKDYVYKGEIEFICESVPHLTLGKTYSAYGSESGISLSLNSVGDGYDLKNNAKKISKETHCAAFSFTFNGFEGKENVAEDILTVKLTYIESDQHYAAKTSLEKSHQMRHEKQLNAVSSVKFVSLSDYKSGNVEGGLKDTITAPVFEKFYAVIDYSLSDGVKIEEADVADLTVTAAGEGAFLRLEAEELPTGDYTVDGNKLKASVRVYGGTEVKKIRFIVSVFVESCEKDCEITVNASLNAKNITFNSEKQAVATATVSKSLSPATKLDFTLSDDGTYYILSGLGTETGSVITVPSRYNELRVKEIGKNAFKGYTHIKEVRISTTVEKISESAFEGCAGIKVTVPKNVETVEDNAFKGCSDAEIYIERATIPIGWSKGWTDDKAYTVWDYDNRFTLLYDEKSYAFSYKGLNSVCVTVPSTYKGLPVTALAGDAFEGCTDLKKVKLPDTVTSLYATAFKSCSILETVVLDGSNTAFQYRDGCLISKETEELVLAVNNAVIPADGSVKSIGEYAFYARKNLTSVTIPDSVEAIGESAFYGCAQLEEIILGENTQLKSIGKEAFYRCGYYLNGEKWSSGTAYEGVLYIGKALICAGALSGEVAVKDGTVCIADYAFDGCAFSGISLPQSLKSIGRFSFRYCKELKNLNVPSGVIRISDYAFVGCEALETVVLSEGVKEIRQNAFSGCTALKSVVLPLSVKKIGYRAFCNCTSLESIKYAGNETEWNAVEKLTEWDHAVISSPYYNAKLDYTVTYGFGG